MNKKELYEKFSSNKGDGVTIKPELCFYNPKEVYTALTKNKDIIKWLNFISNHYLPPKKNVLLIYPCSSKKPYYRSRSYKSLQKTLDTLDNKRSQIHLMTVSEPFGLVPEEFYYQENKWHNWKNEWYDCPGLFEWWCNKNNMPYSKEYVDKSIDCLATYVAGFLKKAKSNKAYSRMIAFVRTYSSRLEARDDHTHRRIIERATQIANVNVDILPKKDLISEIVEKRGRLAWDMYGVAHPIAQEFLLHYLDGVLNEKWYTKLIRLFSGSVN